MPNGCDPCPFDALDDSDGDGVCDRDDLCDGFDDALDADGDTFPDDCDNCPNDAQPQQAGTDDDGDGFGRPCDCDDDNALVHPEAAEICDSLDNDCDGTTDDQATDASTYFADGDGDGEGLASNSVDACMLQDAFPSASSFPSSSFPSSSSSSILFSLEDI